MTACCYCSDTEQVITHYLVIDELSATADSDSRTFSGAAKAEDRTCIWAVRCELNNCSLFCWPLSLLFQYFSNPWFTGLYVIVIDQLPRFVCSIEAQIPRAKPEGWVLLYCIQSEGLVDNYFLAHCFHGYNKHVFSPQELYECLPWPSGTV
jgi:hypothetical protein